MGKILWETTSLSFRFLSNAECSLTFGTLVTVALGAVVFGLK